MAVERVVLSIQSGDWYVILTIQADVLKRKLLLPSSLLSAVW